MSEASDLGLTLIEMPKAPSSNNKKSIRYQEITEDELSISSEDTLLLLVTATEIETQALHAQFTRFRGATGIYQVTRGDQTYYLGVFGRFTVVHVRCAMGSLGPSSSLPTVLEAIDHWSPIAVVMPGIAFGVSPKKQVIGDVLVSSAVVGYDSRRIGKLKTIQRGIPIPCGVTLLNRFVNQRSWKFPLTPTRVAQVIPGLLLSGESLVDKLTARNALTKVYEEAVGGEMEGAGVSAAAHKKGIPWILVKAICDFADGTKKFHKEKRQRLAAESAVSICRHVFRNANAIKNLRIQPSKYKQSAAPTTPLPMTKALFETYDQSSEPAYLQRDNDRVLATILAKQTSWIHGPSGCGKTNALLRYGLRSGRPFYFIDLSSAVRTDSVGLWIAVYDALCERLGFPNAVTKGRHTLANVLKQCVIVTKELPPNALVVFDEFPIIDDAEGEAVFEATSGFLVSCSNGALNEGVTFAVSTIESPKELSNAFNEKLESKVYLYSVPPWKPQDMTALLDLIAPSLPKPLSLQNRKYLLGQVGTSPRQIKKALRKYAMFGEAHSWNLEEILNTYPE